MHDLLRELYERHRPAVLLVTHDVDEAVELADRVLVLEDGRIALDLAIDLPTPRSRRDPRFQEYRDTLLAALGVDQPDAAPATGSVPRTGTASPARLSGSATGTAPATDEAPAAGTVAAPATEEKNLHDPQG